MSSQVFGAAGTARRGMGGGIGVGVGVVGVE